MIQKATATGNWWLAASSWQHACLCITSLLWREMKRFWWNWNPGYPGDSAPLQLWFGAVQLLVFPETKITFERGEISDCQWDSAKYNAVADDDWENCMRSQGAYFDGDWGIIVLCSMFLYLISTSINVSVFHSTWLDTFWTDLICDREINNKHK